MKPEKRNEYHMTEKELHKLQACQRELIREVDRICKKCGIHYNMVGGTMLGAIRHKGYIPWDDDADIGFLRKEYEKFRKACRTELDHDRFYMQDFRDTPGYRWGYGKLRMKGTRFVRLGQENMPYEQGISIDLMPFDNIPDGEIEQKIHFFICFLYRKMFWSKVGKTSEKNPLKKDLYRFFSLIPEKELKKSYLKFIKKNADNPSDKVRILTFPTPKGVVGYKREWYTKLSRYEFDGLKLPGAKDFSDYLKVKYGNFMELPPENKRKIHPISDLKLPENI